MSNMAEHVKKYHLAYIIYGSIGAVTLLWLYVTYWSPMRPGAFLERSSYTNDLYVLVYPDKGEVKNYELPGEVAKSEGGAYTISSISWPNGGYSTFEDCNINIDKPSACTIMNSKESQEVLNKMLANKSYIPSVNELLNQPEYYIKLTDRPVKK